MTISNPWVKLILSFSVLFLGVNHLAPRFFELMFDRPFDVATATKFTLAAVLVIFAVLIKRRREFGLVLEIDWGTLWLYWPIAVLLIFMSLAGFPPIGPLLMVQIVFFAICVGISEELVFRGYFFYWLRHLTTTQIVLISSLAFGAAHLPGYFMGLPIEIVVAQVFFAAGGGVVFGVAKARHFGLLLPIGAHTALDIMTLAINGGYEGVYSGAASGENGLSLIIQGFLFAGGICWLGGLVGLYFVNRKLKAADPPGKPAKSEK